MAAPIANDRKLAANFRREALEYGINFWKTASEAKKEELFFKIASNLIPRLTEVTGEDGSPIKIVFDPVFNATPRKTKISSAEAGEV